ncbi:MAG TPA: ABC transporter ATP-binding protein [Pseudothermotoga sp.]|uniref:ATP-binding cassette domain-containing protein n=1 Tax=Pseudothermotoga lettingae TaxID=177758 RepID=UPI000747F7C9|nr:ABC transporter ATP-binding protein [Pseudothermotoga lettingae]KUK20012.1 MAG: ABC transporter related [Pseudothermotoga lettingae]HBT26905.1 ABC transporter ATP-binding protein [Pseudothermotoga sp.]
MKSSTKRQILRLLKEHFLHLFFAFLLLVCATGMTIPIPLLSKNIINSILAKSISDNLFKIQVMLLLVVSLSKEFLTYASYYIFESRMRLFSASLRKTIFEVAQNNFNQVFSLEMGRLFTYISSDTERIQNFFYPTFVFFMKDLLTFSFALTIGLFLNPLAIAVSTFPLLAFFVLAHYVNPRVRSLTHKTLELQTEFVSRLKEYIQGIEMFQVFLKQKFSIAKFKEFNDEYTKSDIRRIKSIVLFNVPLAILFNSGYIIVIIMGVYQMKIGLMQAGGLVAVLMVINYIYDSARNFWDFNIHRQEIKVVYKRLSEILEAPFGGRSYTTFKLQQLDRKIESLRVHIPSFSYKNSSLLLENFKLYAKKGEIVGLFGKSGIGKSTAIKIILGLLGIEKNYVFVNDIPLSEIEIDSYYCRVGYLPQHSIFFKGTVRENILLGENKPLDEELLEFLDDLSLEKEVEEVGRNLSGGERQRIAIVRTFAQDNKDLYLLDEPTTYLDEMKIRALEELIQRKSGESIILIVSHSRDFLENLCDGIVEFS